MTAKALLSTFRALVRNRSYAFTFAAQACVLVGGLFAFRLAASYLGVTGFGEYTLARRATSILSIPLLLGLGIGLPRYIAITSRAGSVRDGTPSAGAEAYLVGALLIGLPVMLVLPPVAYIFQSGLARWFFGSAEYGYLILPTSIAVAGLQLQVLVYGYFRGHLRMWSANTLQIFTLAAVPPAALLLSGASVVNSVALTGLGWGAMSGAFLIWALTRADLSGIRFGLVVKCVRDLMTYGLPRLPGEVALFGLFSVPTFLVADKWGVEEAGFFSFALSLLQVVGSGFTPASVILLPYASRLVGEGSFREVERITRKAVLTSVAPVAIAVLLAEGGMELIVQVLLGDSFGSAVGHARLLFPAAFPYVVYLLLRGPLDAVTARPYNSFNLAVALILSTLLISFAGSTIPPAASMSLAFFVLGILSAISWRMCLRRVVSNKYPLRHTTGKVP